MTTARVGAVTIGQAPRVDVIPELRRHFTADIDFIECGALDGMSLAEVNDQKPASGDSALASRMMDGTEVTVDKNFVLPRLERCIRALEPRVDMTLLLCTAPFGQIRSEKPLLQPGVLLQNMVTALAPRRLGVLTPSPLQIEAQLGRWSKLVPKVFVVAVSPYGDTNDFDSATTGLMRDDVDVLIMDCIGYDKAMRGIVRRVSGKPVLTAAGVLGKVLVELLD